MSPNWNEYPYWKQFEGNLHGSSEPVPMCVSTNLRIMTEEMVRELQEKTNVRVARPYTSSGGARTRRSIRKYRRQAGTTSAGSFGCRLGGQSRENQREVNRGISPSIRRRGCRALRRVCPPWLR